MRSRSVSDVVLSGSLDLPAAPAKLIAQWEHETACLDLDPGEVEPLPLDLAYLARIRTRHAGDSRLDPRARTAGCACPHRGRPHDLPRGEIPP